MASAAGIAAGMASNPFINPLGFIGRGIVQGKWNPFEESYYDEHSVQGSPGASLESLESKLFPDSASSMLSYGNDFNAQQAQLQRDFEERMSNTAYQRATADLKAAGLNPWILASGGSAASTPSGAAATSDTSAYGAMLGSQSKIIGSLVNLFGSMFKGVTQIASSAIKASAS